ncbi:MAG: hypothetical protein JKY37_14355 [Nannocystaceae bacterium]|nr:hypothetical protein [Nannocystaceae bacterium]
MRGDGWTRLIAALVALILAILTIPGTDDFPLDDAWIHLSYAKSLRLGDGLSYNPGDWETGFSSPMWVALLAMWPTSGAPVLPVKLLGALLHAATAWLAAHIVLDLVRQRASTTAPLPAQSMALLGGVFAASAPSLLQGSTSGMEVPLTAAAILAVAAAMIAGAPLAAGLTGCLAVWCRPEALGFVLTMGTVLAIARFRAGDTSSASLRAAVVAPLGALLGLGLWVMWCWSVSDYPWPNTQYIKGTGGGLAGLSFIADDVLPWQPWVMSLTGVVLLALGLRRDVRHRHYELLALLAAVLATWLAIAVSRPLHPGVGFYEARYFVPFGAPIAVVLPFGLLACRRWLAWALLLPLALVTGRQIPQLRARLVEQASDTRTVHTAVARTIASQLPADAIVAVEGAGATRYFTPRTMTIVDIVGLNDRVAAHLHFDRQAKMCHFVRQAPTHFAIPADWLPQFLPVFAMHPVARFEDPRYTQVQPPRPLTVVLAAVDAINPAWVQGCASATGPGATARPQ